MKLPNNHNTNIDDLILKSEIIDNSFFLSDWNKPSYLPEFNPYISATAMREAFKNSSKYFFMDELKELKQIFSNEIVLTENIDISFSNFTIASNGTTSALLVIQVLNKHTQIRPILLTPIYFSYINLLKDMNIDIEYFPIVFKGKINIDYQALIKLIAQTNSNLLIINDPVFGVGLEITQEIYSNLINICEKCHVTLLVDYVYGGMEWYHQISLLNHYLISQINKKCQIIYIDSVSKRLFINGIKNSLIFADSSLISEIESFSVYSVGCLTSLQISYFKQIYNSHNYNDVINEIQKNIIIAKENYEILSALVSFTDLFLSTCNSGYYCLIYIPISFFKSTNYIDIANEILSSLKILTIPHDRYLYVEHQYYCCRINLILNKNDLLLSINKLLELIS